MNLYNKIIEFFKPQYFEDSPYNWFTNQIAHSAGSFTFVFLMSKIIDVYYVSIIFVLFWLVWEIRHYIISRNVIDFFEDLFFEISGVAILLCWEIFLPLNVFILILLLTHKINKLN